MIDKNHQPQMRRGGNLKMIYEWLEKNRKDIDILTSFLVTVIPVIMLYSEALGITENTIPYCILMIILGVASHYASRMRGEGDIEAIKKSDEDAT